jgi:hypothetical protein
VKSLRKPGRVALIACLLVALAGAWSGATFAAFTSQANNPGNVVTAAPDWKGPTVSGGVGRATGPLGHIKQGDTVALYLDVVETGNPASGVASVTAQVSIPYYSYTGPIAVSSGAWTVRGQSYNYKSADSQLPPIPHGEQVIVDVTATDNAGNVTNRNFTLTIDNNAPAVSAAGVTTTNGGGTQSRIQQNDAIGFNFTEAMDAESILAGWTGGAQNITVRLNNNVAAAGGNDQLTFYNQANTAPVALGSVNLGRTDYTSFNRTFNNSSMLLAGNRITVTFGTASGAVTTAGGSATMVWTTPTGATDMAGNPMSGANWTEPAPLDRDF